MPLDRWFRTDLAPLVDGHAGRARRAAARAPVGAGVRAMADAHRRGAANHGHALWTLLTLETFLRREGW